MNTSKVNMILFGAAATFGTLAGTAQADLTANGGFETMVETTGTLPDASGFWRGDMSSIVLGENDINPFEGVSMLRFNNTSRHGASAAVGAELWQIIDMSSYQAAIRAGNGSVDAGAFFNRVGSSQGTAIDTLFSVGVYAYSGSMDTFPSQWAHSELGSGQANLFSDDSVETWQHAGLSLILPEATDFVVIRIGATENMFNDLSGSEFAGHYADGTTFEFHVVPAPSAILCLLPAGLMGIGRRRRIA